MSPLRREYIWEAKEGKVIIQIGKDRAIVKIYVGKKTLTITKAEKELAMQKSSLSERVHELAFYAYVKIIPEVSVIPLPQLLHNLGNGIRLATVNNIWDD